MKKVLQLALGILTAIGGFFDIGNLVTGAQAGAGYRFQLLWALLLGTIAVIFLVEMSGRFAAVTKKAIPEAVREHFGIRIWALPFIVLVILHVLTLAAEIGGVSFALQLLTDIPFSAWALVVGSLIWLFLWRATFDAIEYSTALLGLVTICFVVAARWHHPPRGELLAGMLPSLPSENPASYWFIAVSIMGALIAPYLFYFYSSGAIEDKWDPSYLVVNRVVAVTGMTFGALISAGAIVVAGMVFQPRGIQVDSVSQAALMLTEVMPHWGFTLFAVSLAIACTGAASEVALSLSYTVAQTFGWRWGASLEPKSDARFSLVYTVAIVIATLIIALGMDPVRLTILTMAANAAVLPIVSLPFLLLLNDRKLLGRFGNGPVTNVAALLIVLLSLALFVASGPLLVLGG